jgi:hypothetical protein
MTGMKAKYPLTLQRHARNACAVCMLLVSFMLLLCCCCLCCAAGVAGGPPAVAGIDPITGKTGLVGTIPVSLANATNLAVLNLAANPNLEGTLPPNLCQPNMEVISLGGCQLSGNITELFQCRGLQALDISSNRFSGALPDLPYW